MKITVIITKNTGMTMYQNQLKRVIKVRVPGHATNKYELTELFLTIYQAS